MDGNYRVVTEAREMSNKAYVAPVTGQRSAGLRQFLPAKYNNQTKLKVEVKAGTESYDFDLESE